MGALHSSEGEKARSHLMMPKNSGANRPILSQPMPMSVEYSCNEQAHHTKVSRNTAVLCSYVHANGQR